MQFSLTEREVLSGHGALGQQVEQRGLAHIRHAHNTHLRRHARRGHINIQQQATDALDKASSAQGSSRWAPCPGPCLLPATLSSDGPRSVQTVFSEVRTLRFDLKRPRIGRSFFSSCFFGAIFKAWLCSQGQYLTVWTPKDRERSACERERGHRRFARAMHVYARLF